MARPTKYDWDSIDYTYINGIDIDTICDKYKVDKKTLQNRISAKKLEVVTGNINSHISDLKGVLGNITGISSNDPIINGILTDKISTVIKDNHIISNNRDLSLAFQSLISDGLRDGIYQTPQDINAGVNSLKGIESIANPQTSKTEINNTNATQNNTEIKRVTIARRSDRTE